MRETEHLQEQPKQVHLGLFLWFEAIWTTFRKPVTDWVYTRTRTRTAGNTEPRPDPRPNTPRKKYAVRPHPHSDLNCFRFAHSAEATYAQACLRRKGCFCFRQRCWMGNVFTSLLNSIARHYISALGTHGLYHCGHGPLSLDIRGSPQEIADHLSFAPPSSHLRYLN